jgi:hypothetical protein
MRLREEDIVAVHGGDSRGQHAPIHAPCCEERMRGAPAFEETTATLSREGNETKRQSYPNIIMIARVFCPAFRTSRDPASEASRRRSRARLAYPSRASPEATGKISAPPRGVQLLFEIEREAAYRDRRLREKQSPGGL